MTDVAIMGTRPYVAAIDVVTPGRPAVLLEVAGGVLQEPSSSLGWQPALAVDAGDHFLAWANAEPPQIEPMTRVFILAEEDGAPFLLYTSNGSVADIAAQPDGTGLALLERVNPVDFTRGSQIRWFPRFDSTTSIVLPTPNARFRLHPVALVVGRGPIFAVSESWEVPEAVTHACRVLQADGTEVDLLEHWRPLAFAEDELLVYRWVSGGTEFAWHMPGSSAMPGVFGRWDGYVEISSAAIAVS
jgi:hypothetical protein